MTDASPNPQKTSFNGSENGSNATKNISEDRKKVLKGLDAHWGLYEQSPEQAKKENINSDRGINVGGNGMGGRKGTTSSWTFGDDGDDYPTAKPKPKAQTAESKSFWDF